MQPAADRPGCDRVGTTMPAGAGTALAVAGSAALLLLWPAALASGDPAAVLPMQLLWAAIWEEALFRGWLQPVLASKLRRVRGCAALTPANLVTSAAFAGLHLLAHPAALAPGYFGVSLLLGIVRERSGGLLAPIALHAAFNVGWWRFAG